MLSFLSSRYVLDINLLSNVWSEKIFSHFMGGLFTLLMVSFALWKLFSLMLSHLSIFTFVICAPGVICKKSLPRPMSRSFFPMLSSSSFTVSGLMFVFNPFWVDFCVMVWDKCSVSFFCIWIFSFTSTIYWRDYPYPIVCFWYTCWKSVDRKCMDLLLGSLFCSIGLSFSLFITVAL